MSMWFLRWRRRPARRLSEAGRRPAVEQLEVRCLPVQITEFSTGITAGSGPGFITRGADGNLWFTELNRHALGRITPGGTVTEFSLAAGSGPSDITSGPGGLLYFTEPGVGRVGRINPLAGSDAAIRASLAQSAVVPSGALAFVSGITAGPDGNLWFTESSASRIGSITPDLATIHEVPTPTAGAYPEFIAAGPDGALWFTEFPPSPSPGKIGRITTSGTITEFPLPTNSRPYDITAGPDGNLWFTDAGTGQIGQITTSGTVHEFPVPPGHGPEDITAGPDGNLWFTEIGRAAIGRLSPAGVLIEYDLGLSGFPGLDGIVTGPDGNLWFAEIDANQIGRLIPDLTAAGTPVTAIATVPFGGPVASFTAADPNAVPGNFTATIAWGDGTPPDTTSGTVAAVPGQPGHFILSGSHTYAAAGSATITVTITDTSIAAGATAFGPATVVAFADSVSLAAQETGPSRATAGGNATYTLTVTNAGPADAQGVTLTDAVPDGTKFVSATKTAGPSFDLTTPPLGGTGTVRADHATLAAGQVATFVVVFQASADESLTNTVTVTTSTPNRNRHRAVSAPVPVPVQLTLSAGALDDYSPPGTMVGTLVLSLPAAYAGQFLPPLYGLPAAEADNAAFALAASGAVEALVSQFRACSGAQASYQVTIHVDVGFGDQPVTVPVTVVAAVSPCTSSTAAPVLESVQAVGGGRRGQAQALALLFGAALDPGSATDLGHYALRVGFRGQGKRRKPITVPLLAAAYDPVRRAVILRLGKFKGPKLRGTLTVEGVLGLDGVPSDVVTVSVDLRPAPPPRR
jgi:virginiamycin B lyase